MADSYTETTTQGFFSRLLESIKGIVVGFLLIVISVVVLFWGEGRAVHRAQDLTEGKAAVVSVPADKVDPANAGKLIHLSADASSAAGVTDSEFDVAAPHALRLNRNVEMYQWKETEHKETKKNLGGSETTTTTYTYDKAWADHEINSAEFKKSEGHQNPGAMPFDSPTLNAKDAMIGAYKLNDVILNELSPTQPVTPPAASLESSGVKSGKVVNGSKAAVAQGMIYFGDASAPKVGDVRISHKALPAGPVSLVAKQVQETFEPYTAGHGTLLLATTGTKSADEMFKQAEADNATLMWIIRGAGFLFILIGFSMILAPLKTVADVIPFVGSIVEAGIFIAAFIVTIPVWFITVALAWIVYRPIVGIALLIIGIGIPIAFKMLRKPKDAPQATTA